ncbi:MAG: translation initiation factor IF-2 [Bacilli bacterium]|jgi:translation initiation factor IF-2|nr:translation initiation factor IF-2 [Bacilli bacterium]
MMNVSEYASDVGVTVKEILELCNKLDIKVSKEDDMLSDDDIIILDNELASIQPSEESTEELEELEELEDIEESYEEQIKEENKAKKKKTAKPTNKNDFKEKRKEMYKHKEKLKSNIAASEDDVVLYKDNMTVAQLADSLGVPAAQVIKKLMTLGMMMAINASLDFDTAEIIVSDYNKTLKKESTMDEVNFEELEITDKEEDLKERPPVVTIMGHVDHGKTTLLDTIRKTSVAEGEAGGITQAIGAYQIDYKGKKITFIDTPGHAAFTEMRARGAKVTDIVIIIVAADDGVMPQTKEAIDHAKAAKVPIIVAVNKIDKPDANVERVLTEMSNNGIQPEAWGGDVMFVNISAKTGEGIDDLLERILLISEIEQLKANPDRYATGTVIESKIDKSSGVITNLLIENGTLRLGDPIVVGTISGRVRTLKNDRGENLVKASPSMPVSITGLSESPSAGDKFMAFENEKKAKKVAEERKIIAKEKENKPKSKISLDDLFNRKEAGEKEINIILKADVKGSEEAVKNSLLKLDVEGIKINVIRSGIGNITESDVILAEASDAIIIGFNIRPEHKIVEIAKDKGIDIRLYDIIYKVVEEMEAALKGKLEPEYKEEVTGTAEVRKLFKFSKVGTIAGSYVTSGVIKRGSKVRVIRDGIVVNDSIIASLAREKDQAKEVKQGLECGITIENFNDIKENDILETYELIEIKK